jgi:F0F1-type ATP synthase delta subunit
MLARTLQATRIKTTKIFSRGYARGYGGLNMHERLGIGEDGVPETIVIPGIAGEFASKFFKESYKRGGMTVARSFEAELNIFTWSVREDPDWDVKTTSPFFSVDEKKGTIKQKCKSLGLTPFFTNRIANLVTEEVNNIDRLEQLRTDYEEIMQFLRKERKVTLITGTELAPSELEFLKDSIKVDYLKPDDILVFKHEVDSSILGGIKVLIEGQEVNRSWTKSAVDEASSRLRDGAKSQFGVPPPDVTYPVFKNNEVASRLDPKIFSRATLDLAVSTDKNFKEGELSDTRFANARN